MNSPLIIVNIIEMERIKVVEALLFATGCFGLGRSIGIGKNLTAIYRSVFTTVKKRFFCFVKVSRQKLVSIQILIIIKVKGGV